MVGRVSNYKIMMFRTIVASAVAVAATAYVPPHMELPATGWKDIGAGTVRGFECHRCDVGCVNISPAVFVVVVRIINY